MSTGGQINWSRMSLEELQNFWNVEIETDLAREGLDLSTRPTYQEVTEAGYSGIAYALREHHDLTLAKFLATVGYPQPDTNDDYPWGIADETTIHELELYLTTNQRRKGRVTSTIQSKRSRLARYVRTYADMHGQADIVTRVRESNEVRPRDERQRVRGVFDQFDMDLESAESKYKHLADVSGFYEWLKLDRDARFDPALGAPQEERWRSAIPGEGERDPPALEADQVRALAKACSSTADRLIVIATCAWGLRRKEVAELSTDQLRLGEDPHIVFDTSRKNGPGTVSIHFGLETLERRINELDQRNEWDDYLFPSSSSTTGHRTPGTITARFKRIAEDAGVTLEGETASPQHGRRFWFRAYKDAVERLHDQISEIAEEQGSNDPMVVIRNYLGEEEARRRRREFMGQQLEEAFGR